MRVCVRVYLYVCVSVSVSLCRSGEQLGTYLFALAQAHAVTQADLHDLLSLPPLCCPGGSVDLLLHLCPQLLPLHDVRAPLPAGPGRPGRQGSARRQRLLLQQLRTRALRQLQREGRACVVQSCPHDVADNVSSPCFNACLCTPASCPVKRRCWGHASLIKTTPLSSIRRRRSVYRQRYLCFECSVVVVPSIDRDTCALNVSSSSRNFCVSQFMAIFEFLFFLTMESVMCRLVLSRSFYILFCRVPRENVKYPTDKNCISCSRHKIVWKLVCLGVKMTSLVHKHKSS